MNCMNCLLLCVLKEQASWPLIDIFAEAAASTCRNQVIQDFTTRKIESTLTTEPVITVARDKAFLDTSNVVCSLCVPR